MKINDKPLQRLLNPGLMSHKELQGVKVGRENELEAFHSGVNEEYPKNCTDTQVY
jgi:hypothetical protein